MFTPGPFFQWSQPKRYQIERSILPSNGRQYQPKRVIVRTDLSTHWKTKAPDSTHQTQQPGPTLQLPKQPWSKQAYLPSDQTRSIDNQKIPGRCRGAPENASGRVKQNKVIENIMRQLHKNQVLANQVKSMKWQRRKSGGYKSNSKIILDSESVATLQTKLPHREVLADAAKVFQMDIPDGPTLRSNQLERAEQNQKRKGCRDYCL